MAFALLFLAALGIAFFLVNRYTNRRRLPHGTRPLPGPKGLPFIGRVHDVPAERTWLKFHDWSKEYGPIYQHKMFGAVHVWISSEKVANDLLAKRAAVYSDRPTIPNLPNNRTSGEYLALLGRTETWKRQRKLCQHLMHTSQLASLYSYPTRERDRFLYLLWNDPANYIEWVEQFTSRTVSRLSWGSAHPAKVLRHTTFGLLQTISPAGALPNIVCFLRYLPEILSPWKQKEKARHQLEDKVFRANLNYVHRKMADVNGAQPSFVRTYLETQSQKKERIAAEANAKNRAKWSEAGEADEAEAMHVVGLMAIAGALTIGSPVQSYLLAMLHYPEWQRKLQQEIDTVCKGRCPQWEDREKLPMLRAVMKEVLRWRPPVPTGIPHAVEKDDIYEGYFIPAGATIHALEWSITRNESMYPDAETFNPARWLDPSYPTYREPLTQHPNLSGYSQFGFGRRTCQGIPIVDQDLFLAMGGMAWAFDIRKKRDAQGNEVPVHWINFTPLLIAKPERFDFEAVPRSAEKMVLMRDMYEHAKEQEEEEADAEELAFAREAVEGGQIEHEYIDGGGNNNNTMRCGHDVLINVGDSSSEPEKQTMVQSLATPGLWA